MTLHNTSTQYSSTTKILHWLIAICVITLLIVGFLMGSFKNDKINDTLYMLHKSIGLTVLVLMIMRLTWRLFNIRPSLDHLPLWQRKAARLSHDLFYLLLIIMPISGWVMSVASGYPPTYFDLFTVSLPIAKNKMVADYGENVHNTLAWVILGLLVIHIMAALKHYWINKDCVMERMWPRFKR